MLFASLETMIQAGCGLAVPWVQKCSGGSIRVSAARRALAPAARMGRSHGEGLTQRAVAQSRSKAVLPSRQCAEPARVCLHPWAAAGQEYSSAQHGDARVTLCCASQVWYSHSWIRGKKPCQSPCPAKPIRCLSLWSLICSICECLSWVLSKCMEASTGLALHPGC